MCGRDGAAAEMVSGMIEATPIVLEYRDSDGDSSWSPSSPPLDPFFLDVCYPKSV